MATAELEAPASGKKTRTKSRREDFMETLPEGVKRIANCPSVPSEFNPDVHAVLKEADFVDTLDYFRHTATVYGWKQDQALEKVAKLEAIKPELRSDFAQSLSKANDLISTVKRLQNAGCEGMGELFDLLGKLGN